MGTSSPKKQKNNEQIYRLYQDNTIYVVSMYIEKDDNYKEEIIMKCSQIINSKFYIYEKRIDLELLRDIFISFNNINDALKKIINLFENNKIFLQNDNDEIRLYLKNNEIDKIIILEIKNIKDDSELLKELIEKYLLIERECINMNKNLENEINKYNNLIKENRKLNEEIQTNKAIIESQKDEINRINSLNKELNNLLDNLKKEIAEKEKEKEDDDDIPKIIIPYEEEAIVDCILKLNPIQVKGLSQSLNLIALGMLNGKIIIINLGTMEIHQEIKIESKVYSLAQLGKFERYLFCSTLDGFIVVYFLKENKYEEIQILLKPNNYAKSEINKVISFSNYDLASCDRGSITIWKQKKDEKGRRKDEFYFYKEIQIKMNLDICQLIEINKNVFACAIYQIKEIIIFKNDEKDYPIMHVLENVESHGYNSNAMAKINDSYFCSAGMDMLFYIICIDPIEIVKKINLNDIKTTTYITCINISENGFLFVSYGENIKQYKINIDELDNSIELEEIDLIRNKNKECKCITITKDGKLFYQVKAHDLIFHYIPFKQN